MFTGHAARFTLFVSLFLGVLLLVLSFRMEDGNVLFLFLGLIVLATGFFAAQLIGGIMRIQKEEKKQKARMKRCRNCEAPLYPEDDVCPYCRMEQTEEKDEEESSS